MNQKWCAVFDCDGTLISKSYGALFNVIDGNGGVSREAHKKAEEIRKQYFAKIRAGCFGKADQEKWLVEMIELYMHYGLTFRKINYALRNVRVRPGVKECFRLLQEKNIPVAIISYGVADFIEALLKVNGLLKMVDKIYAADLLINCQGELLGFYRGSAIYPDTKGEFSRRFADKHGVPYRNILAVGDSPHGDKKLGYLKANRFGIAKDENEKKRLAEVFGVTAVTEDFRPVIEWILKKIEA